MLSKEYSNYCEGDSIIHRLHPSIKIYGLFCFVLLCLLKYNNYLFIANIAFVFVLILCSDIGLNRYIKSVWRGKYFFIILYLILYKMGMSIFNINLLFFKIVFFLLYLDIIKYTTTRLDVSKGIANLLDIFNFINYNIRKLVIQISNMFYFFILFPFEKRKYLDSLDVKGGLYSQTSILTKKKVFFQNFKEIFKLTRKGLKERKELLLKHHYNKKRRIYYKYLYKYKLSDILFVIIYLVMITFYILKVR
jgi:energy-coupling factor transporter transmembrane protein EcfT